MPSVGLLWVDSGHKARFLDVMKKGQLLDQTGRYKYSLTYEIRGLALTAASDPKRTVRVFLIPQNFAPSFQSLG